MKSQSESRDWSACVALAAAAFIFNTSEFIPVGLLSDISESFNASESKVGMIISVYAWAVALLSLPLMAAVVRVDWRKVMLWLVGLFGLFQLASALAPTYPLLMAARIGVACCHSVFWGVVPPYAIASAPKGRDASALGIIVVGSSIAMIVGLPLGRIVGLWLDWRATFGSIAAVSLLAWGACLWCLPSHKPDSSFSLRSVPHLLTRPLVLKIYAFIVVAVTAYFIIYSYIEPYLAQVAGMSPSMVTLTLVVMGLGGMLAGWLFSHSFRRHAPWFFILSTASLALYALLLHPASSTSWAIMALCCMVSVAYTCLNMASQEILIRFGPQPATITVATYSGIFNLGIGSGAFLGGILVSHFPISTLGYAALPVALLAVGLCIPLTRIARRTSNT